MDEIEVQYRIHKGAYRQFLKEREKSQNEVAAEIGSDRSYLSNVVNGREPLSWDLLVRLSTALNVPVDAIATITPKPARPTADVR